MPVSQTAPSGISVTEFLTRIAAAERSEPVSAQAKDAAAIAQRAEQYDSSGGSALTRDERRTLAKALNFRPSDPNLRPAFQSLQTALARPDNGAHVLRVDGRSVHRVPMPRSNFMPAAGLKRMVAEQNGGQNPRMPGWTVEGDKLIAPSGQSLSPDRAAAIASNLQRNRPIPFSVVDRGGRELGGSSAAWAKARTGMATTGEPSDASVYRLPPQANVDGRTSLGIKANPLADRVADALVAAHAMPKGETRGTRPEDVRRRVDSIMNRVDSVTVMSFDGYHQELKGDALRAALTNGALLRTNLPTEGQRMPEDGRWEISPVLALTGPKNEDVHNVWGISDVRIRLK